MDRARLLLRLVVHECVVPHISRGEGNPALTSFLCKQLQEFLGKIPSVLANDPVFAQAVKEMQDILKALLMLVDESTLPDVSHLDAVIGQKNTTAKALFAQVIEQHSGLRKAELEVREASIATAKFMPKISAAMEVLAKKPDTKAVEEFLGELPLWRDSMRPGHQVVIAESEQPNAFSQSICPQQQESFTRTRSEMSVFI